MANLSLIEDIDNKKHRLGRYSKLNITKKKTKIIRISETLYLRFQNFASQRYNTEPYEVILSDLLDCYEKNNSTDYRYTHLSRI